MKTLKERFDEKWIEDKKTGCWEWQGYKTPIGYAKIDVQRSNGTWRPVHAHRIGYQLYTGVDPGELRVCHKCDNPGCVNPDCMFLGTQKQNLEDMACKGRSIKGRPKPYLQGTKNHKAKLTEQDIQSISELARRYPQRAGRGSSGYGLTKFLAGWFGVADSTICRIYKRAIWKHIKV